MAKVRRCDHLVVETSSLMLTIIDRQLANMDLEPDDSLLRLRPSGGQLRWGWIRLQQLREDRSVLRGSRLCELGRRTGLPLRRFSAITADFRPCPREKMSRKVTPCRGERHLVIPWRRKISAGRPVTHSGRTSGPTSSYDAWARAAWLKPSRRFGAGQVGSRSECA